MTRVFVTGMGALTPIGNDVETFWRNLLAGKSGAGRITRFDPEDMPHNMACEVHGFEPTDYLDRKMARRIHRSSPVCGCGQPSRRWPTPGSRWMKATGSRWAC